VRAGAIDGKTVEVDTERSEVEAEVLEPHRNAKTLSGLVLKKADEICVTARTVQQAHENDGTEHDGEHNHRKNELANGEQSASSGST
jgi:hypothetical protein